MSDAPQAPGWWQASDGRWYPPEQKQSAPAPAPGYPPADAPSTPPPAGYRAGGSAGPGGGGYPPSGGGVPSGGYPASAGQAPSGGVPSGGYPASGGQAPPGGYAPPGAAGGGGYPPAGGYAPSGYGPSGGYGPGGYPSVPPPARSSGANGCLIAFLVVLALAVLGGVGSCVALVVVADDVAEDVEEDLVEEQADEADDVSEPRCERGQFNDMQAVVTVTNDSSERSNYTIEVAFNGPNGDQLDTAYATVSALAPGQSTEATAASVAEAPTGDFTCDILDVERFSDQP
jgi:hypothetical protein